MALGHAVSENTFYIILHNLGNRGFIYYRREITLDPNLFIEKRDKLRAYAEEQGYL